MKNIAIFLMCITLTILNSFAQNQAYYFDNYTDKEGLIHNHVLSIFKDSRGILWVGGYGGLQYYDGYKFHNFNVAIDEKTNKLSHTTLQVIYEDQKKNLWFGTESGLNKFDVKTGKVEAFLIEQNSELKSDNIRAITQDNQGNFWIGTYGGGLVKFNAELKEFSSISIKVSDNQKFNTQFINTLYFQGNQLLIGGENTGVIIYDIATQKVETILKDEKNGFPTVNTLFVDLDQNIWVGTWGSGLLQYDENYNLTNTFVQHPASSDGIPGNVIRVIAQKDKRNLWIGTYGNGLCIFNKKDKTFTSVQPKEKKENLDYIWTAYFDKNENWYGTFGYGLMKRNILKSTFKYQTVNQGIKKVDQFVLNKKGDVFYRNEKHGLFSPSEKLNFSEDIYRSYTNCFYIDHQDNFWIANNEFLYCFDINRQLKSAYPLDNTFLPHGKISNITQDQEHNLWISYDKQDVFKLDYKNGKYSEHFTSIYQVFKGQNIPLHGQISAFEIDDNNTLFIGTPTHLLALSIDDKKSKQYPIPVVTCLESDELGNLWVGTNGEGFFQISFRNNKVFNYQEGHGFDCLDIQSLQIDTQQRVWLSTSCGFSVFDIKTNKATNYGESYGLKKFSFINGTATKTKNGQFLFGGNHGIIAFNPNAIRQTYISPPLFLTDIRKDNVSIAYENRKDSIYQVDGLLAEIDTITLDSDHHILTFEFASINYEKIANVLYSYQLEGYDNQWIETADGERTATFTKLPAGEYKLKVKSSYQKGYWDSNIKEYLVVVKGKFYEKIWFKIACILFLLGMVSLIIRSYLKRLKFESKFDLKNKEIFKLHEEKISLEHQNKSLKQQLNDAKANTHAIKIKYESINEHMQSMYQTVSEIMESPSSEVPINHLKDNLQTIKNDPMFEDFKEVERENFTLDFAKKYPKLTSTDLRICGLIRQNKTNKEIAQILNITSSSLEQSRYRIRKKMALDKNVNLNDLILRF